MKSYTIYERPRANDAHSPNIKVGRVQETNARQAIRTYLKERGFRGERLRELISHYRASLEA